MASDEHLKVELDGPGIEPGTVEARSLLDLVSAFLDIIARVAADGEITVAFQGLEIENKCVALVTRFDPPSRAQELSREALRLVAGDEPTRRGLDGPVRRARLALEGLPFGVHANVMVGPWKAPIVSTIAAIDLYPWESTELRAIPIKIGGRRPGIRFSSDSEEQEFTLGATQDLCRRIGPYLYKEIDVSVRLQRNSQGEIDKGQVDEFSPVDSRDFGESLRGWFAENATEWNDVTDVLRELDRRD